MFAAIALQTLRNDISVSLFCKFEWIFVELSTRLSVAKHVAFETNGKSQISQHESEIN